MPWASPQENEARFPGVFPEQGGASLVDLVERVLPASTRLHTPRCVGHQVAAPSWQAPLAAMVGALLNNGMAIYEMGLVNAPTERAAVRFLTGALGWEEAADGVLTSGGSLGNLTALLAAREIRAREEEPRRLCVLASEQAHYCVERATRALRSPPPCGRRERLQHGHGFLRSAAVHRRILPAARALVSHRRGPRSGCCDFPCVRGAARRGRTRGFPGLGRPQDDGAPRADSTWRAPSRGCWRRPRISSWPPSPTPTSCASAIPLPTSRISTGSRSACGRGSSALAAST
jgi:hypothetical protein